MPTRRIFISATSHRWLDERRRSLKAAIVEKIKAKNAELQEFFESGLPLRLAWNFENVDRVMQKCAGAVVIGFPRWTASENQYDIRLIGEYNHYEGAVAMSYGLPTFLLAEEGVVNRGIVWTGGGKPITFFPENADANWVNSPDFQKGFDAWWAEVASQKDVFLGYCSQNRGTAAQIENLLVRSGATVHNYGMDFRFGVSILEEIENARALCTCGIFLFSPNDPLEGKNGGAAPRDNVVFEAGYFMSAKGAERCLIVREGEARMPADLEGAIFLEIKNGDVFAIEAQLKRFIEKNL